MTDDRTTVTAAIIMDEVSDPSLTDRAFLVVYYDRDSVSRNIVRFARIRLMRKYELRKEK